MHGCNRALNGVGAVPLGSHFHLASRLAETDGNVGGSWRSVPRDFSQACAHAISTGCHSNTVVCLLRCGASSAQAGRVPLTCKGRGIGKATILACASTRHVAAHISYSFTALGSMGDPGRGAGRWRHSRRSPSCPCPPESYANDMEHKGEPSCPGRCCSGRCRGGRGPSPPSGGHASSSLGIAAHVPGRQHADDATQHRSMQAFGQSLAGVRVASSCQLSAEELHVPVLVAQVDNSGDAQHAAVV